MTLVAAMIDQLLETLQVVQLPLRNTFRGINVREAALFHGKNGWSEFSPFVEYEAAESVTWLKAAIEAAEQPWPEIYRSSIPINATLPAVAEEEVSAVLARFAGCTTVKIKVDSFAQGAPLVAKTLELIPNARIRIDVNGGWNFQQAIQNLTEFHNRFGDVFEYVEQPSRDTSTLKNIKAQSPIKIAADESIRKNLTGDLAQIRECADIAILKWQPLGGFKAAHRIAKEIGLPVVVSSALDTGIGISHSLALAASFSELPFACGLGTTSLFVADICGAQFEVRDGALEVQSATPVDIERFAAPADRVQWWKNRIMSAGELL